jgi:hypothetical protein
MAAPTEEGLGTTRWPISRGSPGSNVGMPRLVAVAGELPPVGGGRVSAL